MNVGQLMKDTARYTAGNIEKAIIEIIDKRSSKVTKEDSVSIKGGMAAPLEGEAAQKLLEKTKKKLEGKLDSSMNIGGKNLGGKLYYVQFNPSEIHLFGYGGGEIRVSDFSQAKNEVTFEKAEVRITMEVTLIFDQVNVKDAFMADKWNTSPSSIGTGIATGVNSLIGKGEYSVQKEVEGFIAALRSKDTRKINFYWGDLIYEGVLHRVSSRYTMFNVTGQPVRGEVKLSITCSDPDVSETNMGRWQQQYYKAFSNKDQSYVKSTQKVGNLLNFNI